MYRLVENRISCTLFELTDGNLRVTISVKHRYNCIIKLDFRDRDVYTSLETLVDITIDNSADCVALSMTFYAILF